MTATAASGQAAQLDRSADLETVLAACAEGRAPDRPLSPDRLSDEDRRLLVRLISGPVPIDHLQALVTAGLDPNASDEMGLTPLHVAAWEGLPDRLAWALTLDPDLSHRNAYGGDALGTAIHGAEFCPNAETRDHLACARLLLEAGVKYTADTIDECGTEDMAEMLEAWREDA